ncbi:MAG: hypothetical protein WDO70_03085 [Alphaproteobacteria bacterium]
MDAPVEPPRNPKKPPSGFPVDNGTEIPWPSINPSRPDRSRSPGRTPQVPQLPEVN